MENKQGLSILSFDGIRLAFPLSEAVGVQRSVAMENNYGVPLATGSVVHAGRRWPVFELTANFEPLSGSSLHNTYCVCLSADGGQTGVALACEEVNAISLGGSATLPEPMPVCMQREGTPLRQVFRHGEHVVPVSTAPALAAYLRSLMVATQVEADDVEANDG